MLIIHIALERHHHGDGIMKLRDQGMSKEEVLSTLEQYKAQDMDWKSGRAFAYVYDAGREADAVAKGAMTMFLSENALDPTVFPSLLRIENELVSMMLEHLGGSDEGVGNFTSGGTESIMLAVKTARDRFRKLHPEIERPQIVLPETAHAAFQKSAHYLDLDVVLVPVDTTSFRAIPELTAEAINDKTCLIVGSAPSYAHGVVDPIRELGQIALQHDVLLHVDGCVGGFILPYFKRLGANVPDFDFSVPGVTSISVDLHKYAFAPKGASLVLYRNKSLRKHQIYACASWSGYTIVNNAVQSSKSGGPMAAAWATMAYHGDAGYMTLARRMYDATRQALEGIAGMPDLQIMGTPHMNLIAFTSDTVNVFHIVDEMKERGWILQAQLRSPCSPTNIHLSINPHTLEHMPAMLEALEESIEAARTLPSGNLAPMIQDAFANLDPSQVGDDMLNQMLAMAGIQGVGLPGRMAEINEVLDALPSAFRETLLIHFVNELFIQRG